MSRDVCYAYFNDNGQFEGYKKCVIIQKTMITLKISPSTYSQCIWYRIVQVLYKDIAILRSIILSLKPALPRASIASRKCSATLIAAD